jgi:hypothetical protein
MSLHDLLHQFRQFLPLDLGLALDDAMSNEPSFEVTVAPRLPNAVVDVIVVISHQGGELVSLFLLIRFENVVVNKPLMLRCRC